LKSQTLYDQFDQSIFIDEGTDGSPLLGGCVGNGISKSLLLNKRIDKIRDLLKQLPLLEDAQTSMLLIRSCLGLPKIAFALRTMHFSYVHDTLKRLIC
jgi:hypothetical protein